jgi:hypothetical protein
MERYEMNENSTGHYNKEQRSISRSNSGGPGDVAASYLSV